MSDPLARFRMDTSEAADLDDPSGRLRAYLARTEIPLDLLALVTLWIVVIPPGVYGHTSTAYAIALTVRIALSAIYAVDAVIRVFYAREHARYPLRHPVVVLSVILPPLRVVFSFRLIRSLFRRGHIDRFLIGASLLLLNGAAIVYFVERNAAGA